MTLSISSVIISEILEFGWSVVVLLFIPITCRYLFLHWFEHWSLLIIYILNACILYIIGHVSSFMILSSLSIDHANDVILVLNHLKLVPCCSPLRFILVLWVSVLYSKHRNHIWLIFSCSSSELMDIFFLFIFSFRLYAFFLVPNVGIAQQRWQFFF